jgi:hypothetical protein
MAKRGPTPLTFTSEQHQMVEAMAGFGIPHDDIAKIISHPRSKHPIDPTTLRKYFRRELDTGHVKANAKVAKSLYEQATSGNVTAAIWWTKCRMGWKETVRNEHTGKDGAALPSIDPASLTDEQFESFATRVAIAFGVVEVDGGGSARTRKTPQSRDGAVH